MRLNVDNEAIVAYVKEKGPLNVQWNAGGDSRFLKVGEDEDEVKNDAVRDALSTLIILKLDLPSVGDIYDRGNGVVHIQNEQVVITYSCVKRYEGDDEDTEVIHPIDDAINLRSRLHRIEVDVCVSIDCRYQTPTLYNDTSIHVLFGEAINADERLLDTYQVIPDRLAWEAYALPYNKEGNRPGIQRILTDVSAKYRLTSDNPETIIISRSFEINEHVTQQTEILI